MGTFRLLPLALALGAGLSGCDAGPRDAAYYARRLQSQVGRAVGPMTMKSIVAEGNVLVVTFDGAVGWRRGMPSYAITAYFLEGFCAKPDAAAYFADGRTLRVDSLEAGASPIRGSPAAHCPRA